MTDSLAGTYDEFDMLWQPAQLMSNAKKLATCAVGSGSRSQATVTTAFKRSASRPFNTSGFYARLPV